jgi:hypothetical protein
MFTLKTKEINMEEKNEIEINSIIEKKDNYCFLVGMAAALLEEAHPYIKTKKRYAWWEIALDHVLHGKPLPTFHWKDLG